MPWTIVRKKTPCGWEEEEVWVEDEPAKVPAKTPAKKNKKRRGYDVTKEFERIKKKEPAIPA